MSVERKAFVFNDEQMKEFREDIANIDRKISPHTTNLTPEEKQPMWKLGPQSLPFVVEALKCAKDYPQFRRAFFDLEKFEKDFTFYNQVRDLAKELAPVIEKLTDSAIAAGADSFTAARSFFEGVKAAAKANKAGADAVVERLQKVFYKRIQKRGGSKKSTVATSEE